LFQKEASATLSDKWSINAASANSIQLKDKTPRSTFNFSLGLYTTTAMPRKKKSTAVIRDGALKGFMLILLSYTFPDTLTPITILLDRLLQKTVHTVAKKSISCGASVPRSSQKRQFLIEMIMSNNERQARKATDVTPRVSDSSMRPPSVKLLFVGY